MRSSETLPARAQTRLAALGAVLLAASSCSDELPSLGDPTLDRGQAAFQRFCAECHGKRGDGQGPAARYQPKPPRNFLAEGFRFHYHGPQPPLGNARDEEVTDADLFRTISDGVPGSTMPSFAIIPVDERWAVVAYLRHLRKSAAGKAGARARPPR
jgi:mono/diheme cytochrome c family protein